MRVCEMETTTFMTFSFHSSPASHSFLSLKPVNPSTDAAESVNDLNRIKQNEQNCSAHPVRRSIIIVRNQSTVSVSVLALEGFAFLHLLAGLQHLSGGLAVCRCIVTISSNGLKKGGKGREGKGRRGGNQSSSNTNENEPYNCFLDASARHHLRGSLLCVWQVETDDSPFKQFNTRGLLNQVNAYE